MRTTISFIQEMPLCSLKTNEIHLQTYLDSWNQVAFFSSLITLEVKILLSIRIDSNGALMIDAIVYQRHLGMENFWWNLDS